MGEIHSDTRVRVYGGGQLAGQVRLPELDDVEPYRDPLLDRVGRLLGEHPIVVAGTTALGGIAAAATGGNLLVRGLKGVGGAAAALLGTMVIGNVAQAWLGHGSSTTGDFVDQDAARISGRAKPGSTEHLKVMDWNVRELIGDDGEIRTDDDAIERIRTAVDREHPDVLLLQEVRRHSPLEGGPDNLDELAKALGASSAVFVPNGTRPNGAQKGQAVLTFGDTTVQDARGLHHADPNGEGLLHDVGAAAGWAHDSGWPVPSLGVPGFHPRTTADVMVTTPAGTAVRVLNVHLSGTGGPATGGTPGSRQAQDDQLVPIADTIDAWQGPTLLAGDFNVRGGTEFGEYEAKVLGDAGLTDSFTQVGITPGAREIASFPSWNPDANIDRLYTSKDVHVTSARIDGDPDIVQASDHRPLVADVEIRG